MSNYWQERMAQAQTNLTNKSIKATEKQLTKYYSRTMQNCIKEFERTYEKLLNTIESGREPTPADLYKLDTYWQMQGQLKGELLKLGEKQIALLSDEFVTEYQAIYEAMAATDGELFNVIDTDTATQMINQIWCADGKSWSSRVWMNTEKLQDTLNEHLINCVVTGKTTRDLKNILQEDFNVSYGRADSIVRTEMAHIQTQAARQRYQDIGVQEVEILADEDERRCDVCGKLHGKRYPIGANVPVPAHPRCRCCIVPVIDI